MASGFLKNEHKFICEINYEHNSGSYSLIGSKASPNELYVEIFSESTTNVVPC